ncbi:MAG: hypothetical protein ACRD7E_16470 [Bryobacteraceae bacterium]
MPSVQERRATVGAVLLDILRHPRLYFIERWNWKSALTSAIIRAIIFFSTNLRAGLTAAAGAMAAEFLFRLIASGFYGSLTQAFRRAEPAWLASITVMILLPLVSHSVEFLIHWLRGTPELRVSIIASVSFTVISTLFNLYAMRRGTLIVGEERKSLGEDLRAMPGLIASFLAYAPVTLWRLARSSRNRR